MVRGGRAIPPTENSYLFVFVWEFPLLLFLISNAKPVTWNSDFRTLLGSTGEKVSSTEPRTPASNGTDHQPMLHVHFGSGNHLSRYQLHIHAPCDLL